MCVRSDSALRRLSDLELVSWRKTDAFRGFAMAAYRFPSLSSSLGQGLPVRGFY